MQIDFLNNLQINKLDLDDYNYRYVCYDGEIPIASYKVKLNVDVSSIFEVFGLPEPDVLAYVCFILSAFFIIITIMCSPDVSSKL